MSGRAIPRPPRDSSSVALLAFLLQRDGKGAEAAPLRQALTDRARRGYTSAVDFVMLTGPLFQELHKRPGFLEARKRLGYR